MSVPDVKGIVFLNLYYFYEFMGKMMHVYRRKGFFRKNVWRLKELFEELLWLFCHVEVKIWTTLNSEDVLNKAFQKPESNENILRNSKYAGHLF